MRLAEPQRPQCRRIRFDLFIVNLVRGQEHWLTRAQQDPGGGLVCGGGTDGGIDHQDHRVGGAHGYRRLLGHQLLQPLGVGFPSPGVLHDEPASGPQCVVEDPVPRHARNVLHHRFAPAQDAVDQCRFADIWPSHDRHHRRGSGFVQVRELGIDDFPVAFVGPGAVLSHRTAPLRCLTKSIRWVITSASVMSLVSTTTASEAARSGETARVESRWSRRRTSANTPS